MERTIFDVFDTTQVTARNSHRPLREHRASEDTIAYAEAMGVDFSTTPYTLTDSRSRQDSSNEANTPAYESILPVFPAIMKGIHTLREELYGADPGEQISVQQAEELSLIATALPYWALHRAGNENDMYVLDDELVGMHQIMLGMEAAFYNYHSIHGNPTSPLFTTPVRLYSLTEKSEKLVGRDYSCPAPAGVIRKVFEVILNGDEKLQVLQVDTDYWKGLLGNMRALRTFARDYNDMKYITADYREQIQAAVSAIEEASNEEKPIEIVAPLVQRYLDLVADFTATLNALSINFSMRLGYATTGLQLLDEAQVRVMFKLP